MKRFLSMILALALMVSCLPMTALGAQTPEYTQLEPVTKVHINPLYADVIDEAWLVQPRTGAAVVSEASYTDAAQAAVYLRSQMKQRAKRVAIQMVLNEFGGSLMDDIFNQAVVHTGVPTEGDYLLWQYGGWNGSVSGYSDGVRYYLTVTYDIAYYTTADQERRMDSAVSQLLERLDPDTSDPYSALKTVYDYMTANITYDYENLNDDGYLLKHSAYAALINKTAVCQGYAVLLYRLLLELGIDNRVITGLSNGGGHAWNIVQLDGKYYNADSTWDASWAQVGQVYSFFLRSNDNFDDHIRDAAYQTAAFNAAYPMSDKDYVPGSDSHAHSYAAVVTAPTCTEGGYTTYTCSCGDRYVGDQTEAAGHSYGAWVVTREPGCAMYGEERRECSGCGNAETRQIDLLEHDYTYSVQVIAPTCTVGGYTTYTCACGDSYVGDEKTALGHEYGERHVVSDPTCTVAGESREECTRCGAYRSYEIPAVGHSYDAAVTAPTCTEGGYTTYICACGDRYVGDEKTALGHEYGERHVVSDPTCTVAGESREECTRCGAYRSYEIPAVGHSYDAAVTAPTCTEGGYTTYTCACGDSYVDDETAVLGHSFTDGVCTVCGALEVAFGDANGDGVINNVDAMLVLQYAVGLKDGAELELAFCDVNGDGYINNVDAMQILQFAVGLITEFKAAKN